MGRLMTFLLLVSQQQHQAAGTQSTAADLLWPLPRSIAAGSGVAVLAAAPRDASFFGAAPSALLERAFARYAALLPSCPPVGDGGGVGGTLGATGVIERI